jgi:hypothetical protein
MVVSNESESMLEESIVALLDVCGWTEEDHEERPVSLIRPVSDPRTFQVRRRSAACLTAKLGRK